MLLLFSQNTYSEYCFIFQRDPNHCEDGLDLVTWPRYTSSEQAYLDISLEPSVKYKLHPERMAFWNEFIPKLMDDEPETKRQEGKKGGEDEL